MNHFNLSTIRYGALYLLISLSSNISSSLINSSSEYRFPYPILSTIIHLFLSLLLLTLFTSILNLYHSPKPSPNRLKPTISIIDISKYLINPNLIAASIASTLATLLQFHQSRTSTPEFTAFTRYLSLLLVSAGALVRGVGRRKAASIGLASWFVLNNGRGVDAEGLRAEWTCAVGSSVAVIIWVVLVRQTMREPASRKSEIQPDNYKRDRSGSPSSAFLPIISTHLILSLIFLLPPLLLSSELPLSIKYNHLGSYLTEPGFWLQELGVSGCSLLNLIGFYKLLEVSGEISEVFLWIGIKNFVIPFAFAFLLDNPLDNPSSSRDRHALLSSTQQALLLLVLAAVNSIGGERRGKDTKEDLSQNGLVVEEVGEERMEGKYTRDEEKGNKAS